VLVRGLTLMLKAFRCSHLTFELGADLVEEIIESFTTVARGNRAHSTMARVHRHDDVERQTSRKCNVARKRWLTRERRHERACNRTQVGTEPGNEKASWPKYF
jgi:hypothetical protein